MARRRLLPKPKEPPEGYMLFYRRVWRIEDVERFSKELMGSFDQKPRPERDRMNYPEEYQ